MSSNDNKQAFDEKGRQVSHFSLVAFGIRITSRYAKANELAQLLGFSESVARNGAAHLVLTATYDSKCGSCELDVDDCVIPGSDVEKAIARSADLHLDSYELLGRHGGRGTI